jgi:superfamily I DNA and/or RNA helicase
VLTWVNVKGKIYGNSKRNKYEAKKVLETLKQVFPSAKQNNYQIGVTTPFRNQAEEIIQGIPSVYKNIVTADTVHKFQGNEKDIMIFSPVITEGATKNMINFINIGAPQLLNVAITRARHRLIVVGDLDACMDAGGLLKRLAVYMRDNGAVLN